MKQKLLLHTNPKYHSGGAIIDTGILDNAQDHIEMHPETKYIIEDNGEGESADELDIAQASEQIEKEEWLDEEINKLVVFYIDNKKTFLSGATKKKHLWAVACRTMLRGKNSISCEAKLRNLKNKYAQICVEMQSGKWGGGILTGITWQHYDICHQAFHDDSYVQSYLNEIHQDNIVYEVPLTNVVNEDGILVVKKNYTAHIDVKVEAMLSIYIRYKNLLPKSYFNKTIWETIALELGNEDADYWHKRFLNFKQHYIRNLYKKQESGLGSIHWPYMKYFEQIYGDDEEFQNKIFPKDLSESINKATIVPVESDWSLTDNTFLAKYYFDCLKEFQDPSIPNGFLWHEVGRFLAKKPENCKMKLAELKSDHLNTLISGPYDLHTRTPLAILFDNIISKETETELEKSFINIGLNDMWKTDQLDELVNYLYESINMLKDSVCYFVCWAVMAIKMKRSVLSCKQQWNNLTELYKSILEDKKENSDLQIDWRYIEIFDRIFDYGLDTNLLDGYVKFRQIHGKTSGNVQGRKITFDPENETDDEECYDERGFYKRSKKGNAKQKAIKILEYYLKNKDKFGSPQYKKLTLWEGLAKEIGISASECAHRFRNFKQEYTGYVQKEINKPEMPILWPHYGQCKKVFGYRVIKSKLKHGKAVSDDPEDWSAKGIKKLINYFAKHFYKLKDNVKDTSKWTALAKDLGRTESSCCDKFLELRKSYRKLKTMKSRNPDVKVSWKYFNMIDQIYNNKTQSAAAENMEEDNSVVDNFLGHEDEDFQCIIVLPEGAELFCNSETKEDNNQKLETSKPEPKMFKWNKRSKMRLLRLYLQYSKTRKNTNKKTMWVSIASQLKDKSPGACRKMYLKLRKERKSNGGKETPYKKLMNKILALKRRVKLRSNSQDGKTYEDVIMSDDKVVKALQYYLNNLDDFVSPNFEKKYLWDEIAKYIAEPAINAFNKINFLKQSLDNEKKTPYDDLIQQIRAKENRLKADVSNDEKLKDDSEMIWSDVETERLLTWYLAHLDKFKNPKFLRSYLWMEASDILKKNPLVCSKKMSEIRSEYRTMVKENPNGLEKWRFYNLCQRIYGTGKKQ